MPHGLKISDALGNVVQLTPDVANIVESGTVYLPRFLWPDDTFGAKVKLPGLNSFADGDVGVLVNVRDWGVGLTLTPIAAGFDPEQWGFFKSLNPSVSHYTYDISTGKFTSFPAHARDTIYNQHGIAFWNKAGQSSFDTVLLLATTVVYIYDYSESAYKKVFLLSNFVPSIDFAVFVKNLRVA